MASTNQGRSATASPGFSTLAIHAGEQRDKVGHSITDPIFCASTYTFADTQSVIDYIQQRQPREEYGRYGNPGEKVVEAKLAQLDGGQEALLFASGMAAFVGLMMARLNSGDEVVFFDPYRPSGTELALGLRRVDNVESLLRQADVLSIHTPLTNETENLINAETLAMMRSDAILVNTARGPIVHTAALLSALREGRIAAAALDVLPVEPSVPGDPLVDAWRDCDPTLAGRLILSPHAAFYSPDAVVDMRRSGVTTILACLETGSLQNCVNLHLLKR